MNLMLSMVISSVGLGYFIYGKKLPDLISMIVGGLLMIYPYFVKSTLLALIIGIVLCAVPYLLKRYFGYRP